MILQSWKNGFVQLNLNRRMIIVYYLTSLIFGLILMTPMWSSLRSFIGGSEMGGVLAGNFDWDFLFEFIKNNPNLISTLLWLIVVIFIIHTFWSLFLSGGAFTIFAGNEKYTPAAFWGGAAKYFGRFVRLAAWSLVLVLALIFLQFLPDLVQRVFFGKDPYQNITYWMSWVKIGFRFLCFLFFKLVLDYARIHTVMTGERIMRASFMEGVSFASRNFFAAFGLSLVFFLAGALVLLLYNPLADSLSAPSGVVIFVLWIVQQLYLLCRKTLELALYASQVHLYRERRQHAREDEPQPANELGWEGAWA